LFPASSRKHPAIDARRSRFSGRANDRWSLGAMSHIVVLKFGSSVLRSPADLPVAVDEIYRHVRAGRRVIAVVSAFAGVTDSLIERAHGVGGHADPYAFASLVGSGEIESAAMLALSLAQHGVPARLLPPEQFSLRAHGDPLDAEPHAFDEALLQDMLSQVPAVVVPGFVAHDERNRTVLLGRGGSDFTALFLAGRLGADCILVKDVDGLYERDPAAPGPAPRRFTQVTWDDALRVAGRLVQPKTIRFAHLHRQSFSVTCAGAAQATIVGPGPSRLESTVRTTPLRVVLLGLGTVGRGVYERLAAQPDRFEVVRAVVRDPAGHVAAGVPAPLLSTNPWDAVNEDADVVVEALGGEFPAAELVLASLLAGRQVVTANKAAIAAHWDSFSPFATGPAPRLRLSAAAGGAVPLLEAVARESRARRIVALRGVLNGTCNYVLDRVEAGAAYAEALAEAQSLGFAEADPTADVSGLDAARKLRLCALAAAGRAPARLDCRGIDDLGAAIGNDGTTTVRLLAELDLRGEAVQGRVGPVRLPRTDYLAAARGEDNRVEIEFDDGAVLRLAGKGAGRWPTTVSVCADLWDVAREPARCGLPHAATRWAATG
jgi:homoserine dehydrogenase